MQFPKELQRKWVTKTFKGKTEGTSLVFTVPVTEKTTITGMSLVTKGKFEHLHVIVDEEVVMETHWGILLYTSPFEIPRQGSDILQIKPDIMTDPREFWETCSGRFHEEIKIVLHKNQNSGTVLYVNQIIHK